MTPERSVSSVLEQSSLFCARRRYSPHFLPSVVVTRVQPPRSELRKGTKSAVPLADRAIGNLQQWLLGTHHGVSRDQLQVYLDEFVFRHNRRHQPMAAFQTLLGLGTGRAPTSYWHIRGARDMANAS